MNSDCNRILHNSALSQNNYGRIEIENIKNYDEAHCYHSPDKELTETEIKEGLLSLCEQGFIDKRPDGFHVNSKGFAKVKKDEFRVKLDSIRSPRMSLLSQETIYKIEEEMLAHLGKIKKDL